MVFQVKYMMCVKEAWPSQSYESPNPVLFPTCFALRPPRESRRSAIVEVNRRTSSAKKQRWNPRSSLAWLLLQILSIKILNTIRDKRQQQGRLPLAMRSQLTWVALACPPQVVSACAAIFADSLGLRPELFCFAAIQIQNPTYMPKHHEETVAECIA